MAYKKPEKLVSRKPAGFTKRTDTSVRLTGLFASKRDGLFVGTARPEELAALADKMREAKAAGTGLTFFVWENDRGGERSPAYTLKADVAQEAGLQRARSYKASVIEDEDEPEGEEDLPF